MIRVSVAVVVVVALSNCTFGARSCKNSAECAPSTDQCIDGFCVSTDGGTGGGTGGGSTGGGGGTGGGTTGGGTGGSTGGGTGGGGMNCDVANCMVGQQCGVTGCEATSLEIVVTTKPNVVGPNVAGVVGKVQRPGGGVSGVKLPTQVDANAAAGLLVLGAPAAVNASGDFSFNMQAMPGASGSKRVTIAFAANSTMVQTQFDVTADTMAPVLGLVMPSNGEFKRDAVVSGIVTSSEALADAGVSLGGAPMRRLADGQCMGFSSTPDAAACFEMDFSAPVLNALDGGFSVALSGSDGYGNSGGVSGGSLLVTRLRWEVAATSQQIQALAVGSDGMLFAGTSGTGTNTILGLSPDGSVIRDAGALGEVQSLAVGPGTGGDVVYASFNPGGGVGSLGAVEGATLQKGSLRSACEGAAGSKTYSGLALYRPGSETFAVGSVNSVAGVGGTGCIYRPYGGSGIPFGANAQLDAVSTGATATNVVINGSSASFLTQDTGGAWWQPVTLGGTAVPVIGARTQFGSDASAVSSGQAEIGSQFLIGGIGATNRLLSLRGASADAGTLGAASADKGVPSLGSMGVGFVGTGDTLVRFNLADLNTSTIVVALSNDSIRTAPVLGATRGSLAEGYAISRGGTLVVFAQAGAELWRARIVGVGDSVLTHMAFDCNRARPSTNTGLLYVGTAAGRLASIIVDSPKLLDTGGAWPKYQRTMGNAGNTDTGSFPINWPACP